MKLLILSTLMAASGLDGAEAVEFSSLVEETGTGTRGAITFSSVPWYTDQMSGLIKDSNSATNMLQDSSRWNRDAGFRSFWFGRAHGHGGGRH
ncbi:hypothetical protein BB559_000119 [Furculomyces boomerangus]|uniref:Uncharacterized protein n=1 Tax=Furculomyces boomerangus TaxID=61424 RepID=A0A2T9Z6A8_9FUNG|nr:hypothetical protein BB559_000119 [Furculomyces boomerangus]